MGWQAGAGEGRRRSHLGHTRWGGGHTGRQVGGKDAQEGTKEEGRQAEKVPQYGTGRRSRPVGRQVAGWKAGVYACGVGM